MVTQKIYKIIRPIVISALFLVASAYAVQYGMQQFLSSFDILASKDLGKILFTCLGFLAVALFLWQQPKQFQKSWISRNINFLSSSRGLFVFVCHFALFFTLHALFLACCYGYNLIQYNSLECVSPIALAGKLLFGFGVTYLLALTEEIFFRGTLFPYFSQWLRPISAALLTSFLFMIVHFLPNPLAQIPNQAPIALGLFLLGLMLNMIYLKAGTMWANIGTHAGLVFVKVILRKVRFLVFAPAATLPWFLHSDLRQAPLVHLIFGLISILLMIDMHNRAVDLRHPNK